MDTIDRLIVEHSSLRGELARLTAMFAGAHGVGWDDRLTLDRPRLLAQIRDFQAAFKSHETRENECLATILPLVELDRSARDAFEGGHRFLEGMTGLLGVVGQSCDGDHVHSVRTVLIRLGQELEAHLAFEETVLFPAIRRCAPASFLRV